MANQSQPDPTAPISLGAGEVYKDADFGYVKITTKAIIGDTVWYDANADGMQEARRARRAGRAGLRHAGRRRAGDLHDRER